MQRLNKENINSEKYWDEHIAEPEWGLRQEKYLELAGKGDIILEYGCGLSPFLERASKNFRKAYGADFSEKTIEEARKKFPNVTKYYVTDATKWYFPTKLIEVSVAGELIEHLEEPEKFIEELARITKRRIIISTAKMEYNDPEHLWEFTKKDLQKMGEKYGKTTVEEIPSDWFKGRSYLFMTIDL